MEDLCVVFLQIFENRLQIPREVLQSLLKNFSAVVDPIRSLRALLEPPNEYLFWAVKDQGYPGTSGLKTID